MSEREQVIWKLRRLWKGKAPRVLDLFAGCGGFSLGFRHQGFEVAGAIESDESAVQIHGQNFFEPLLAPYHSVAKDITQTDPKEFLTELRQGEEPELAIDVIIGGPPCQAFSRIGRAKLREIANSPDAHLEDPRAQLYKQYIRFVRELKPLAVVMENVTDILSFDGRNVPEEICETLDDMGYECRYTTLNAVHFGVPQLRERMFLLGLAKELKLEPVFPEPTHHYRLPTGYQEGRKRAIGFAPEGSKFFIVPVDSQPSLPKAVGVKEALNDLPAITDHLAEYILPTYATDEVLSYRKGVKPSNFARQMRNWEALKAEGVSGHVIRYLPRDFRIFSAMSPGDQYPDAHRIATRLFEEELDRRRRSGQTLEVDSEEYLSLQKEYVPPYDPGKFPDKWRKLDPREPSRTLTAHLARDSYSHIHYDSEQARTISMREAARLQSFPDGFQFDCAMGPALKAIGNAVPPLLASEIASCVRDSLKAAMQRTDLQLETEFEGVRHIAAFRPRAKLVSLLGDQLISDAAVGLIELVKNSYDADATNVDVTLQGLTNPEDTVIIVHDNGIGMSLEDLTGKWFSPATSHKEQAKARNQRTKLGRLPIGEKGVGRFAAHKLGRRLTLVTRKEDQPEIVVSVDWDEFDSAELFLDGVTMRVEMREPELYTGNSTGTRMEMAIARSSWNLKLVKKVHRALRRLQSPFKRHRDRKFCVGFRCPEHPELENIDPVEFLERSHYNIKVRVSKSGIATYTYSCAHPEVDSREIENKESLVPLALSELSGNKPACGPFAFELYVWQRSVKHMKQSGISPAELNAMCGVSIYRDGLRVYPYGEPGNDWLYLDQERIQSPSEKLGNNQVVGLVYIDQGRNLELRDKTNREGLIENDAFNDLRALIRAAIKLFSVYWRKDRPGKEEKNYVLPPIGHEELARFLTSKLRDDNEEI